MEQQYLLLIFFLGVIWRVRGTDYDLLFNSRLSDKAAIGWLIAALVNHAQDWFTIPIIGMTIGILSIGWGAAIGSALRGITPREDGGKEVWWLKGFVKDNAWLAVTIRGFISGSIGFPLAYWDLNLLWIVPAFTIGLPMGIGITRLLAIIRKKTKDTDWLWEWQEYWVGWCSGSLLAIPLLLLKQI